MGYLLLQVQFTVWIMMIFGAKLLILAAETEIRMTSPVNPVRKGGMLSLHCRVLNFDEETQTVAISHEMADGGKYTALTMGEKIYTDDERTFLAVRRLADSSKVYFMSIINVRRSDEGIYKCKLLSQNPIAELKIRSVPITVMHVPDNGPECVSSHITMITSYTAGDTINLNCSSEQGSPTVTLAWYRSTNSVRALHSKTHHRKGIVISELSNTLYESDNTVIFICKLSSEAFPDLGNQKTCHIGPITVRANPSFTSTPDLDNSAYYEDTENTNSIKDNIDDSVDFPTAAIPASTHCTEYCSALTAPVMYWIIATIAISVLAIIFLIIGIVMSVKLCNTSSSSAQSSSLSHAQSGTTGRVLHMGFPPHSEDTYAELEGKPDENRVYMMLDRSQIPEMQPLNPNLDREGNYTRTPTAIKEITLIPTQCV